VWLLMCVQMERLSVVVSVCADEILSAVVNVCADGMTECGC